MLDHFDLVLLNLVQRNDSRTAASLATEVPLSPSAIARRLRRLRAESWINRTIALLSPKLTNRRLRALVLVQLTEHADKPGIQSLLNQISGMTQVQFCYEIAGIYDFLLLIDCAHMDEFTELAESVFASHSIVRRYESSFVKREVKFAPFVDLTN